MFAETAPASEIRLEMVESVLRLKDRWDAMCPWRKATWEILSREGRIRELNPEWNVDVDRLVFPEGQRWSGELERLKHPQVAVRVICFWLRFEITPSVP